MRFLKANFFLKACKKNIFNYQTRKLNQYNSSKNESKIMPLKDRFNNYDVWRNVEKKNLSFQVYKVIYILLKRNFYNIV
jgi:hypothetical protein